MKIFTRRPATPVVHCKKPSVLRWGKAQVCIRSRQPIGNGCLAGSTFLANSADPDGDYIGAANALEVDEQGWAEIPYGEWPHSGADGRTAANRGDQPRRVIQRFTREDAVTLVNDFRSTWSRIKRAFIGLNLYKGHPDAPRYAKLFPDKEPRGVVADMEAGERGLRIRPVLTPQGAADVQAGHKYLSPYWGLANVGQRDDGTPILAPVELRSIGLVTRGNIPGLSLTNAAEISAASSATHQETTTMPQWLIDLLIGANLLKAGQSDEGTIRTALANFFQSHDAIVIELKDGKARLVTLEAEKTALANAAEALKTEKAALETRANAAESSVTELRKQFSTALVNAAIADGRVPAAEKDAKITALCNAADFGAEQTALAALRPTLRTQSRVGGLAQANATTRDRSAQVTALVNAYIEEHSCSYDEAFAAVSADAKHAALFAGMKRSEGVKAKG